MGSLPQAGHVPPPGGSSTGQVLALPLASSPSAPSSLLGFPSYKAGTSPIPYLPGGTLSRSEIMSAAAHLLQREAVSRQSLFLPLRAQTSSLFGAFGCSWSSGKWEWGLPVGTHRPVLSTVREDPQGWLGAPWSPEPRPGLSPAQPLFRVQGPPPAPGILVQPGVGRLGVAGPNEQGVCLEESGAG